MHAQPRRLSGPWVSLRWLLTSILRKCWYVLGHPHGVGRVYGRNCAALTGRRVTWRSQGRLVGHTCGTLEVNGEMEGQWECCGSEERDRERANFGVICRTVCNHCCSVLMYLLIDFDHPKCCPLRSQLRYSLSFALVSLERIKKAHRRQRTATFGIATTPCPNATT